LKKSLLKLYRKLTLRGIKNFDVEPDVAAWRSFLKKLPQATSAQQRSLNKYACRMYYFGRLYRLGINAVSIFALMIKTVPKLLKKKEVAPSKSSQVDAVLVEDLAVGYADILPDELSSRYPSLEIVQNTRERLVITDEAFSIFLKIWRKNIWRPLFSYWVFRELAFYSGLIESFSPKAIIVYVNERNVASPILKEYLESKGIKFITFMHGDYILQLIQGFMDFSEFYAWDQHYVDMFVNDLYCPEEQFRVYFPQKYNKQFDNSNVTVDITYFLGSESEKTLLELGHIFRKLKKHGKICFARRHPRRFNDEVIAKYIDRDQIQDPTIVSIDEAISQSKYISSIISTVLLEAYFGGKQVLLDDCTDPKKLASLVERKGLIIEKPHMLLSEYLIKELD
jgi:hypothetical protein